MPEQPSKIFINGVELPPTKKVSLEKLGIKKPVGQIIDESPAGKFKADRSVGSHK